MTKAQAKEIVFLQKEERTKKEALAKKLVLQRNLGVTLSIRIPECCDA